MTTALTTTIPSNVPAHVSALFAKLSGINTDASEGISQGMHPLIKLSGTRFVLVKDGEETAVKTLELKVVVLRAKKGFEKRYFAKKFDPNSTEATPPDCFSMDGISPASGCTSPQNATCAGCKNNMFGSGTDQNGNPGKGKACSDRKVLAVLYPNPDTKALEIYGLSLPPASLKSFGAYVNTLTSNNIPLPAAFTTIGFDERTSFPVLTFSFGGMMGEKELSQVIPMVDSDEVRAIVDAQAPAISPVPPVKAVPPPAKEESGFGFPAEEPPKVKKEKKEKVVEAAPEPAAATADDVSDEELSSILGIDL